MYLNWETSVEHIFFKSWTADTPTKFVLATALIFLQSFLYEGLMSFRTVYEARLREHKNTTLPQQLFKSFLFALGNLSSLYLMMIFMTYNGILCLSLVLGAFAGHLFFAAWCPAPTDAHRPRSCCA